MIVYPPGTRVTVTWAAHIQRALKTPETSRAVVVEPLVNHASRLMYRVRLEQQAGPFTGEVTFVWSSIRSDEEQAKHQLGTAGQLEGL